jgi:hypothetical protein
MFTKFVTANQVRCVNWYKNTKHKILKCNADVYVNKLCLKYNLTFKFDAINIKNTSAVSKFTGQKISKTRHKDEIQFLYICVVYLISINPFISTILLESRSPIASFTYFT